MIKKHISKKKSKVSKYVNLKEDGEDEENLESLEEEGVSRAQKLKQKQADKDYEIASQQLEENSMALYNAEQEYRSVKEHKSELATARRMLYKKLLHQGLDSRFVI